ncbi:MULTISPECIES: hypothetical protein [Pseudanabaena]|uniref:Uncharacterized protein n=2 Tax=Pseudanabaena TaxID=1152 RepID=L8N183_9CYAN|nr:MULTISPECIES: hypothetical protein [Pseudanabaena]ELS32500.1 hypothetical protein Pse7429DRAFT_2373 [Pseudanabaena biceps PCC 7429]MDG3495281.1 hypothetical protein [Pseudanabaena catenata USMAC16]
MYEWGIRSYQPKWSDSATELLGLISRIPLIGSQVQALWSLWDEENDEWFNDAPVVICTQENQLEFCANKLNEFSISLDSINLSVPVYWCEDEDPDTKSFRWVQQRNPEFRDLVGKLITGIEIVESRVERDIQIFLGLELWILSGIALQFQDERLEILNGLDCNILSRSQKSDERKYTQSSQY